MLGKIKSSDNKVLIANVSQMVYFYFLSMYLPLYFSSIFLKRIHPILIGCTYQIWSIFYFLWNLMIFFWNTIDQICRAISVSLLSIFSVRWSLEFSPLFSLLNGITKRHYSWFVLQKESYFPMQSKLHQDYSTWFLLLKENL